MRGFVSFGVLLICLFGLSSPFDVHAQPFGLTQRTVVTGLQFPLDDPAVVGSSGNPVELVRAFPSLTFSSPVFMTSARDGSNRLFVVQQTGAIQVFQNSDATATKSTFLDLSTKTLPGGFQFVSDGEQGLLGLAFDPNFITNRYFYVYYSVYSSSSNQRRSVVSRFQVSSGAPNVADPASESIVIQVPQELYTNHKGGNIAFGPDHMLYINLGDGGSGGDPNNNAQNCTKMLGKILRLDVSSATPYAIPSDNPFAGAGPYSCGDDNTVSGHPPLTNAGTQLCGQGGTANNKICKEIYAYGLRNPFRSSFDRITGQLWVGDVGQDAWEEVDLITRPGLNLGWRYYEGTHSYNNPNNLPLTNFLPPITEYQHGASGYCIIGGFIYRGSAIPELYGKYVYGDNVSGKVWALSYDGTRVTSNQQLSGVSAPSVSAFGEDEAGELYAVNLSAGTLSRFRHGAAASGPVIPPHLSQTGLFQNLAALSASDGIIEFDVNAPLWSDYAQKKRWIALPGTSNIGFSAGDAFSFPVGTALIKNFSMQLSASQTKKLETRVLFRHNQGWQGYTYKWNDAQSDADLLTNSATETLTITDPSVPGGARTQQWYYPGRGDCLSCHTPQSGTVLGVRTRQLNKDFSYGAVTDNQLRSWNHIGLFSSDIGNASSYQAYAQYTDSNRPVVSRARAYLASNCSHCHQPGIPSTANIDLRYDTAISAMQAVDVRPTAGDLGLADAFRIKTHVKESSVLWERMRRLDGNRMPKLGSSIADPTGVSLIGSWIDQLPGDLTPPGAPSGLRVQ